MEHTRSKSILIRLSDEEYQSLIFKSSLFNTDKSKLIRQSALSYWDAHGDEFDADTIFELYKSGDETVKQQIVNVLFEYYRRTGYPHRQLSHRQLVREMEKISVSKCPLLEDDHLQVNAVGIPLANYFHPHMVKVQCLKGYRSPYDQYIVDDLLKDAIKRWMDIDRKPTPSGIRRILRTRDGVRSVVNFKPVIARYIYDTYAPAGGNVLDPCAGYGGRLCGCIASNRNLTYHGIDPMGETAVGNMKLASLFSRQYELGDRVWKFGFNFSLGCAEDVMLGLSSGNYDLVFTSIPYYNTERYDTAPNQSYIKFPSYSEWVDGFMLPIIKESHRLNKPGGYLVWNVKNYRQYPIADDSVRIAEQVGFRLMTTYQMRLTNNEFHLRDDNLWHTEPIFVFRK